MYTLVLIFYFFKFQRAKGIGEIASITDVVAEK
jgi:hypothetical protein